MLKKLILIALAVTPFCLNGQKNYYLKLYPVSMGYSRTYTVDYSQNSSTVPAAYKEGIDLIGTPFLSLQIANANGRCWEVGLGIWGLGQNFTRTDFISGSLVTLGTEKNSRLELSVERFKRVFTTERKSTAFSWGYFLNARYDTRNFKPDAALTNWYELDRKEGVLYFGLVPRLESNLTKRLHFDLNIPVSLVSAGYSRSFVDNPDLTKEQNTSNIFDFDFWGRFNFRLGLAWRLNNTRKF